MGSSKKDKKDKKKHKKKDKKEKKHSSPSSSPSPEKPRRDHSPAADRRPRSRSRSKGQGYGYGHGPTKRSRSRDRSRDRERRRSRSRSHERKPAAAASPKQQQQKPPRFKIFVGNLSQQTREVFLAKCMQPFGAVKCSIIMERDDPTKSRGFGFVEFETQEEMERAIEASDGKALHGNEIRVNEARSKEDKEKAEGSEFGKSRGRAGDKFQRGGQYEKSHAQLQNEDDASRLKAYYARKAARDAAREQR